MSYYKNIFKNLPFPCLLFEKKKDVFVIKEANTLYCKATNRIEEDLIGKIVEEAFPENPFTSGKEVQESLKAAYTSQKPHKIDVLRYDLYDDQNGLYELKYWETENIPILDEVENVQYILNVVRDITSEIIERDRSNILQLKLDAKTEKHEQFVERITDGLFSLDREGNFVSLNTGLIDIAETPETELLKMNFLPFCGPDHREEIISKFNAAIGGTNQKIEANFISGKGRKKILDISIVPLKSEGKITGLYGIAKDITRLKEFENALLQSGRKFKALVQEGSDLIGILDVEGKYKFVSETSSSVLGIPPMDFIGKTNVDYIHPEDKVRVLTDFLELESKNQIQIKPFRFKNGKGEWRWIETKATNLINDPAIGGIVINSRDVTDQINSQKAIKESEERYRCFFENSTDAVLVTVPDGKILAANPSACKMFQRSEKELCLLGRSGVTDPLNPRLVQALKLRKETGTATVELTFVRKDGTQFPGEVTSSIFKDSEGNALSSMIIRDITERKLAEKAIKDSNMRYELVSKATSDAICDWDLQSNVLLWGDAFYTMSGYTREDFSPTIEAYLEKIHPEEKQQIVESLNQGIEGSDNYWKGDYRFRMANGKYASLIVKAFILRDEKGKAFRMVGAIQDVTEKKKLEELLDEASRFARIGSFEIDCEKDTKYWSPVIKEIHEVGMDYVPTLEIGILFFKEGESRNAISNAYLKALKENLPYDLELQIVTAKGNERWVRKIGRPTFVDGKCVRINGSFQDITNIKNSELEALKASAEKEIILESIGDAFFMVDNDWIVTYWNRHSETLLECPRSKILGKYLWDVYADAIDTKFYTCYQKAVKEQSIEYFEEYFERAAKWFEVTAYPSHSGLSVYFKDITERKESELQIIGLNNNLKAYTEELVEANKGLEQFTFIVSHNLRSPVANIIGLADLIDNEEYPEEVKNNFLKALLDNVKRLDIVISDLNAILQVKVEMDAKKEPVLLNNLVDAIKTSIQNLIEKEEVEIITHFDVLSIHTVQSYLHSIFYNLIANSIKYRKPDIPPQIVIRSENKEGAVVITIEDNGLGIDLSKKGEQVFGLYRRFHNHIEGKGMGLFLVKTQVELLGGKISIKSEVNAGTIFTITFKEKTFNYISENEETSLYGGR